MQTYTGKLTKEFCRNRTLLFFLETKEDAVKLQQIAFDMGYKWGKGNYEFENGSTNIEYTDERLLQGICLDKNGILFAGPNTTELQEGLICTLAQFDPNYVSPEQTLLEKFNALAARVEEIGAQVQEIHTEVMPARVSKPGNKL